MDVKEIIKDTVSIEDVVTRLESPREWELQRHGYSLQGNCPKGHASQAGYCFSVNTAGGFFKCFHCGISGDIISLVQLVNHTDFKASLKWLAENFRPDLLSELDKYKREASPEAKEYYEKASLYDLIYEWGKGLLYEKEGKKALDYLVKERGYQIEALKQSEWIYYPKDKEIRDYLLSKHPEASQDIKDQVGRLKLQGYFGDHFRLAFPYRDRRGAITGFVKRAIEPKGVTIKPYGEKEHLGVRYDSTAGLKKHDLFNLYACKGYEDLVIVEGYPDALYLPTLGLKNIVAIGQGLLSKDHIEGLKAYKVKRVTLSLDNDPPKEDGTITGVENTEKALNLLKDTGITVFVIAPPSLSPVKDPDEYVKAKGMDAFKELVKNAQRGTEWKAQTILDRHDLKTDMGTQGAIDEAMAHGGALRNPLDQEAFKASFREGPDISQDTSDALTQASREKKDQERVEKGYDDLLRKVQALKQEGKVKKLGDLLASRVKELQIEAARIKAKPRESLSDHLRSNYDKERQRDPDKLLGFGLDKFGGIQRAIDGIQPGFYILGADTNIGKTAFLTNLFLDILFTNHHTRGLYFSLDDNKDVIITRFIGIQTGIALNQIQKKQTNQKDHDKVDKAYKSLMELADTRRLNVLDVSEVSDIDALEVEIVDRAGEGLFVVIDGLQNIQTGKSGDLRELSIERANRVKALVDIYQIPIICTTEVRKTTGGDKPARGLTTHDIIETDKFAYNANLIWLLYPENRKEFKNQEEPVLILAYDKNKLSHFTGYRKLKFTKRSGLVEEIT